MEIAELERWIELPEDDHHDFKEHWYHKGQKSEMIKDIFSFINTAHGDNCYLILGVSDDHQITGVEDDKINRLNQQQLLDFIRRLPISGEFVPNIKIDTMKINDHEIDIIEIIDTKNVPCFFSRRWNEKGIDGNYIYPGQVFARNKDTNTGRDATATFQEVKSLWEKHFRMNVPIQEGYSYVLSDTSNWSYIENEGYFFLYNLNPDFYMELADDEEERYKAEAFSIDQIRTKMSWRILKLKYRQISIKEYCVVWLDGGRFLVVAPPESVVSSQWHDLIPYYNFVEGTLEANVEKLFESGLPLYQEDYSRTHFYESVVWFNSEKEKSEVQEELSKHYEILKKLIDPSKEEIEQIRGRMGMDFKSTDSEMDDLNITYMLKEHKMGEIVNQFVSLYRIYGQFPEINDDFINNK